MLFKKKDKATKTSAAFNDLKPNAGNMNDAKTGEIKYATTSGEPADEELLKKLVDSDPAFNFGIWDLFDADDSNDIKVLGKVVGLVKPDSIVFARNIGEDDTDSFQVKIKSLELDGNQVAGAVNTVVGLTIENGKNLPIRKTTVLYTPNEDAAALDNAYISSIGDTYVIRQNFDFSEDDLNKATITDLVEAWRLFNFFQAKKPAPTEEERAALQEKVNVVAKSITEKVLSVDEIYCVYNKNTGEPHMFSKTSKQGEGYYCAPPDIMLVTKSQIDRIRKSFNPDVYDFKLISNEEDGKGIYNFLGSCFYMNGACGVIVNTDKMGISAEMLVAPPDYTGVPEIQIPVMNPDVTRWLLMMGQIGEPKTDDEKLIYGLYHRFFRKNIIGAKLLVPCQGDGEIPTPDENGNVVLKKDTHIAFASQDGKGDKSALRMYTDWKRLRMVYDTNWNALVMPVDSMIETFDVVLNYTEHIKAGTYFDEESYKLFVGENQAD